MGNVIVNGASFTILITTAPPMAMVPPPPALVVSSNSELTGEAKDASLKTDMEGQSPVGGVPYVTGVFTLPGVLEWDGDLLDSQESTKLTKDGNPVIVDDTISGSTNFTVTKPAQMPDTTPDPVGTYPGIWTLVSNPNTKLTTNE